MAPQAKTLPAKNPSVASDLLMLGDVYLTLGWLAVQRLRYGPLWPWDQVPRPRPVNGDAEPAPVRRA
jgi:hypothetical protein